MSKWKAPQKILFEGMELVFVGQDDVWAKCDRCGKERRNLYFYNSEAMDDGQEFRFGIECLKKMEKGKEA